MNLHGSLVADGGPAESDGRLKIGDKIVSIQPLSPEAWISSHSPSVTTQSPQLVLASLESQHPGPWVVVVLRHGCDDVIEVEITPNASSGGRGGGPGVRQAAHNSSFGAAAIQKNLWEQLVQATAPKKANWQTKAARVCSFVYSIRAVLLCTRACVNRPALCECQCA